ncbi:uncharacterized protein LOC108201361 [Daucus carota subsp. sativus]|uniref:uncharacterized protein LOC108201361 n=1 Tax=Daucus carota subsp. sativus TaxID=79200 RepID=UPI0007EF4F07|nr:PREDICTED: uncharacterized protein LOC108201361 [Daucus carota subsp. sativus]
MSSYSSSTVQNTDLCQCGLVPVLKTSWTDNNPGRRFWSCRMYLRNKRKGCGYYRWHDPPVEGRSKNIIPDLLRKIEMLEEEIKELKRKEQKDAMWLRVVIAVVLLILGLALLR